MTKIVGLSIEGATARARRGALLSLDADSLAERFITMIGELRSIDALPMAEIARLPLGEVVASPYALRSVALGIEAGGSVRHLELRRSIDWLPHSEIQDELHGSWVGGSLRTGKYQGFTADAPFGTFDPSHGSKWGPHELLHRAGGFFFRSAMSRWELYLGARLNELVPVVAWYGPEQAMRLDEGAFDRRAAGQRPSAPLGKARWLGYDADELAAAARIAAPLIQQGVLHFERELDAIDEEIRTSLRVPVAHPFLDSSSDATAYVVGHYDRLSRPAVGEVLTRIAKGPRCSSIGAFRDRVEQLFDRLLFGELAFDPERSRAAIANRRPWDLLLRAAHLPTVSSVPSDLLLYIEEPGDPGPFDARLVDWLGPESAAEVLFDGSAPTPDCVAEGLEETVPYTVAYLGDARIAALAASPHLLERAPLSTRLEAFLESELASPAVLSMLALETAILGAGRDDAIERLCVSPDALPDALLDGTVIASTSFELLEVSHDVLQVHADVASGAALTDPVERAGSLLVGGFGDAVAVVPVPSYVVGAFQTLRSSSMSAESFVRAVDRDLAPSDSGPADGQEWLRELLEAGALGWRP